MRAAPLAALAGVVLFGSLVSPVVARAQTRAAPGFRPFISANAGISRPSDGTFTNLAFDTDGFNRDEVRADYRTKTGAAFDVGGGVIFGSGLMAGLAVSHAASSQPADLTLTLSHPAFHPSLTATTTTETLKRSETGVHLQVGYALRPIGPLDVMVFAGPSHFEISQPLVVDFFFDEIMSRPGVFSAVVSDPVTERKTGSAWGYNAGTDIAYRLTPGFSIGTLVRYSRATVSLDDPLRSMVDGRDATQDVKVGGIQATAGVRFRF
jgi:hypothetical protein